MAKTKALISFAVSVKLICAFVFANADCWFSHEAAHTCTLLFSVILVLCVFVSKQVLSDNLFLPAATCKWGHARVM